MTEISYRIRTIRQARRMTQEDLGRAIGRGAAAITALESGRNGVNQRRLVELATALCVEPDDILSDDWRRRCERDGISLEAAK